jgi:hypothetical protein
MKSVMDISFNGTICIFGFPVFRMNGNKGGVATTVQYEACVNLGITHLVRLFVRTFLKAQSGEEIKKGGKPLLHCFPPLGG